MYNWTIRAKEKFKVIVAENFPKLITNTKPLIHKVQKTSTSTNTRKNTHRFIIFKLCKIKDKEKILGKNKNRNCKELLNRNHVSTEKVE